MIHAITPYFNKLQDMISGPTKEKVKVKKAPKAVKAALAKKAEKKVKAAKASPAKKAKKEPKAAKPRPVRKVSKAAKKKPREKMITNMASVLGLVPGSTEGISTSELKEKTGLSERQIWSIVNRASKAGKIRKVKRGVYGGVATS